MSANPNCTVYVGNLDERVSDRVLYDILIQAGRVVDLHIPRDRETDRPKGFAFAEYETKESADYAVRLFTGLVTLYNRTLKFGISGQDKSAQNSQTSSMPTSNSPFRLRPNVDVSPNPISPYPQVSPSGDQFPHASRSHVEYEHRRGHGHGHGGNRDAMSHRYDAQHHDRR